MYPDNINIQSSFGVKQRKGTSNWKSNWRIISGFTNINQPIYFAKFSTNFDSSFYLP